MAKGYPRLKAEIVDLSSIQEIETSSMPTQVPVFMQTYTSDKGSEDWELMVGLENFVTNKGAISIDRHGQSQLTVAEILRNGGAVVGKRMVSDDATLANTTVRARVVRTTVDGADTSLLYLYGVTETDAADFKTACNTGYDNFVTPTTVTGEVDAPLFTIAPVGRGISDITFRLNPEYSARNSNYMYYSFLSYENAVTDVDNILCTLNPNIVIDGVSQGIAIKVQNNSEQLRIKVYNDGIGAVLNALATTTVDSTTGAALTTDQLLNMDFIFGYDTRGKNRIGGMLTNVDALEDGSDAWSANIPSDIETVIIDINKSTGIRLPSGGYGTLGANPILNTTEYTKVLLQSWGKLQNSMNFNPVIYDQDRYKVDAVLGCNYPVEVNNQIQTVIDFRGDGFFFCDLGTTNTTLEDIINFKETNYPNSSINVGYYHNWFDIYDPYSKAEITVTMPFLLVSKLVKHIAKNISSPVAGIANSMEFPDIIQGTINFLPYTIPGIDQKQELVDHNINYLNFYGGTAVMDTMYTDNPDYTELSYISNVMNVQNIIKRLRTECPRLRYTFIDGDDLEKYIDDVTEILAPYQSYFETLTVRYMADEKYELNKIFYAALVVRFHGFFQEEYFKIFAIN